MRNPITTHIQQRTNDNQHCVAGYGIPVGEGAGVGAGSVMTRDIAPKTIVAENPARVIGVVSKRV
jgi:acetyltransferase-like isoleucine patch superfamily enzyme